MASLFDKFLVAIGLLALAHAAYSAAQHRAYLRLTEQEFTTLPADVTAQTLVGLLVACYGIVRVVGRFREIRTVDVDGRTGFTAPAAEVGALAKGDALVGVVGSRAHPGSRGQPASFIGGQVVGSGINGLISGPLLGLHILLSAILGSGSRVLSL